MIRHWLTVSVIYLDPVPGGTVAIPELRKPCYSWETEAVGTALARAGKSTYILDIGEYIAEPVGDIPSPLADRFAPAGNRIAFIPILLVW
ncbi:hypothetical protein H5T87_06505 [bacterium]|nr:hypothetical protein [bacterium]